MLFYFDALMFQCVLSDDPFSMISLKHKYNNKFAHCKNVKIHDIQSFLQYHKRYHKVDTILCYIMLYYVTK
jgi:hypothetical protein